MLTDLLIGMLGTLLNTLINLIPSFPILDTLLEPFTTFIQIGGEYIGMCLWFFNINVVKIVSTVFFGYYVFTAGEYVIKLIVKYITRIL